MREVFSGCVLGAGTRAIVNHSYTSARKEIGLREDKDHYDGRNAIGLVDIGKWQ
jgi:hypothetical protein